MSWTNPSSPPCCDPILPRAAWSRARFEQLYRLFFHELREDLDAASLPLAEHMASLRREMLAIEPQMPALAAIADFLGAAPEAYLRMLREMQSEGHAGAAGSRGAGANMGSLVRRLPVLRALNRARETLSGFLDANRTRIHWETRSELKRHVERRLETARRMLTANGLPKIDLPGTNRSGRGCLRRTGPAGFCQPLSG